MIFVRQTPGLSIPSAGVITVATTHPRGAEMSFQPCALALRDAIFAREPHVAQASWPARKLYAPPRATSEASC